MRTSGAVRLKVPKLDVAASFEEQADRVAAGAEGHVGGLLADDPDLSLPPM